MMSKKAQEAELGSADLDALAERLHAKMEHLDPTEDEDWGALPDARREFYRLCVTDVIFQLRLRGHVLCRPPLDRSASPATGTE